MEKSRKSTNTSSRRSPVLVFRSNINTQASATLVCKTLLGIEGIRTASVDLEDWEKVLRLECNLMISALTIEKRISEMGFSCSELE